MRTTIKVSEFYNYCYDLLERWGYGPYVGKPRDSYAHRRELVIKGKKMVDARSLITTDGRRVRERTMVLKEPQEPKPTLQQYLGRVLHKSRRP